MTLSVAAIALSPSLDVTYVVEELTGIQRPTQVVKVGGGKALNAARAASRMGAVVDAVALLGGGAGHDVAAFARADGVTVHVVEGEMPTRTCVSVLSAATGELTEIYEHAVAVSPGELAAVSARAAALTHEAPRWWLLSGGLPPSVGAEAISDLVGSLSGGGSRVALDTHGAALTAGVEAGPALVKVNRAEAASLLELDGAASDLAARLAERCQTLAVVTDGEAGAYACDGRSTWQVRLDARRGSYPVGSGDAFLGGMVAALAQDSMVPTALAQGAAAGWANAQQPGAGCFDGAQALTMAERVEVRTV